jgi:hypothetical protein
VLRIAVAEGMVPDKLLGGSCTRRKLKDGGSKLVQQPKLRRLSKLKGDFERSTCQRLTRNSENFCTLWVFIRCVWFPVSGNNVFRA